jgi:hypothetical protein
LSLPQGSFDYPSRRLCADLQHPDNFVAFSQHLSITLRDNGGLCKRTDSMKAIAASPSRGHTSWGERLTQNQSALFSARTPLGRSTKIVLFGIGAVLPLGTVIWALLLSHGLRAQRASAAKPLN